MLGEKSNLLFTHHASRITYHAARIIFKSPLTNTMKMMQRSVITNLTSREFSFSPDAAYYMGKPTGMKFYEGAPIFAVEVRSEGDYWLTAEQEMADKRADYFAAGTLVVWDVDLLGDDESDKIIRVYRASDPENPTIYRSGEIAEAEPALPEWTFPVDNLDDLLE